MSDLENFLAIHNRGQYAPIAVAGPASAGPIDRPAPPTPAAPIEVVTFDVRSTLSSDKSIPDTDIGSNKMQRLASKALQAAAYVGRENKNNVYGLNNTAINGTAEDPHDFGVEAKPFHPELDRLRSDAKQVRTWINERLGGRPIEDVIFKSASGTGDQLKSDFDNDQFGDVLTALTNQNRISPFHTDELIQKIIKLYESVCIVASNFAIFYTDIRARLPKKPLEHSFRDRTMYIVPIVGKMHAVSFDPASSDNDYINRVPDAEIINIKPEMLYMYRRNLSTGEVYRLRNPKPVAPQFIVDSITASAIWTIDGRTVTKLPFYFMRNYDKPDSPPITIVINRSGSTYSPMIDTSEAMLRNVMVTVGREKQRKLASALPRVPSYTQTRIRNAIVVAPNTNDIITAGITSVGPRGSTKVEVFLQRRKFSAKQENYREYNGIYNKRNMLASVMPQENQNELLIQTTTITTGGATKGKKITPNIPIRVNALLFLALLKEQNPLALPAVIDQIALEIVNSFKVLTNEERQKVADLLIVTVQEAKRKISMKQYLGHPILVMQNETFFRETFKDAKTAQDRDLVQQMIDAIYNHFWINRNNEDSGAILYDVLVSEMFAQAGVIDTDTKQVRYRKRYDTIMRILQVYIGYEIKLVPLQDEDALSAKQGVPVEDFMYTELLTVFLRIQRDISLMLNGSDVYNKLTTAPSKLQAQVVKDIRDFLTNKTKSVGAANMTFETTEYEEIIGKAVTKYISDGLSAFTNAILARITESGGRKDKDKRDAKESSTRAEPTVKLTHFTHSAAHRAACRLTSGLNALSRNAGKRGIHRTQFPAVTSGGRADTSSVGRDRYLSPNTTFSMSHNDFEKEFIQILNTFIDGLDRFVTTTSNVVRFNDIVIGMIPRREDDDRQVLHSFAEHLRFLKRTNRIPFDTGIYELSDPIDPNGHYINVVTTGDRFMVPVLVVDKTKPGIVPLGMKYIERLKELRRQHDFITANRIFTFKYLPLMISEGHLEWLDPIEYQNVGEHWSNLESISRINPLGERFEVENVKNSYNYVNIGRSINLHTVGQANDSNQDPMREQYNRERTAQTVERQSTLARFVIVDFNIYYAPGDGHRELVQNPGYLVHGGTGLATRLNTLAAVGEAGFKTAEESHVPSHLLTIPHNVTIEVAHTFHPDRQSGPYDLTNNALSRYPLSEFRAFLAENPHLQHIHDQAQRDIFSVLVPQIGSQINAGDIIIPIFGSSTGSMSSKCIKASNKQIGVVTGVHITMDNNFQIVQISVFITRRCVAPTAVKASNAQGQKGEMSFPNFQQTRVNGGVPVGLMIPASTAVKRSTPAWIIEMLLYSLAVATFTRPRYGLNMTLRNPNDEDMKTLMSTFKLKHRQMGFDADGRPTGLTHVGPTSMNILYITAVTKTQTNPGIADGERPRDPMTGMPKPIAGSNTATLSQQGLSFLPDNAKIIDLISSEISTDRTRQVYCQHCKAIGYIEVGPVVCVIRCNFCHRTVTYEVESRRVIPSDRNEIDNFSSIYIRRSFISITQLFRATGLDCEIYLDKQDEELGEYIE